MCEICANAKRIALETNYKALSLISSPEYLKQIGDSAIEETQLEFTTNVEKLLSESTEAEIIGLRIAAAMRRGKKKKELIEKLEKIEGQAGAKTMERVGAAGRRLLQNPEDEYALMEATKAIENKVNIAEMNGNPYYRKYFPRDAKTGRTKEISLKSPWLCGWEIQGLLPIFLTSKGKVVIGGVQSCGKVWTCPVCGAKINVRRREEIKVIVRKAAKEHKAILLLTVTAPHNRWDTLSSLSRRMALALSIMQNSKTWRKYQKQWHSIRCVESKIGGENGAHNHFHFFLIVDEATDEAIIKEDIFAEWENACIKAHLFNPKSAKQVKKFRETAVNLKRDFDYGYLTKQASRWKKEMRETILPRLFGEEYKEDENGLTPFGFVADLAVRVALGLIIPCEFEKACELFIEYCCAMHGRHQIVFSRGLRKWAGLFVGKDEQGMTDEEICAMQTDRAHVIGGIDKRQHRFVRKNIALKTIKKAIAEDGEDALQGPISDWFEQHGLGRTYSKEEAKLYVQVASGERAEDFDLVDFIELEEKILASNRKILPEEERFDSLRPKKKAAGG